MSRKDAARAILTAPTSFAPSYFPDPLGRDEIRTVIHAIAELERSGTSTLSDDIFAEFCQRYHDCLAARHHSDRRFGVLGMLLLEVAYLDVQRDDKRQRPPSP